MNSTIVGVKDIKAFMNDLKLIYKASTEDEALLKAICLSIRNLTKKWTGKIQNWGQILNQLQIYFEGRITEQDLI